MPILLSSDKESHYERERKARQVGDVVQYERTGTIKVRGENNRSHWHQACQRAFPVYDEDGDIVEEACSAGPNSVGHIGEHRVFQPNQGHGYCERCDEHYCRICCLVMH